jgi:hypothetical protein
MYNHGEVVKEILYLYRFDLRGTVLVGLFYLVVTKKIPGYRD